MLAEFQDENLRSEGHPSQVHLFHVVDNLPISRMLHFLIMHRVGNTPWPMHYGRYATRENVPQQTHEQMKYMTRTPELTE
jgi:hypothetical protein